MSAAPFQISLLFFTCDLGSPDLGDLGGLEGFFVVASAFFSANKSFATSSIPVKTFSKVFFTVFKGVTDGALDLFSGVSFVFGLPALFCSDVSFDDLDELAAASCRTVLVVVVVSSVVAKVTKQI